MHIKNSIAAYSFDKAVAHFGTHITAALELAAKDAKTDKMAAMKQQMVLNRWLVDEHGRPVQRFRDPARR